MEVIVGTAGHIDHGKSALVRALTGVDPDRLPEERSRGITIDLGFAELDLGDHKFGFVDVPGHERFVRNMLAGASGIDVVILVVAANEGVMPQTREHFDICRLLGVNTGIVALTKTDLVDAETIELARSEVEDLVAGSFLENAEIVAVSAKLGIGLDEIRSGLSNAARALPVRDPVHSTYLPIDRSFSVKGFGTVVTGTLSSGTIAPADELELLPEGRRVRVRGLQSHGKPVESVVAGQRAAVNLAGVDHVEIERGMSLGSRRSFRPVSMIDAEVNVLADASGPIKDRQRLRVHIGTAEAMARTQILNTSGEIPPGGSGFVQLRFEKPVIAIPGERFIIRKYSPQVTIGGGRVIDNAPQKHGRREIEAAVDQIRRLDPAAGSLADLISEYVRSAEAKGMKAGELQIRTGIRSELLSELLDEIVRANAVMNAGERYVSTLAFDELKESTLSAVRHLHSKDTLAKGMSLEAVRDQVFPHIDDAICRAVIDSLVEAGKLEIAGDTVRLPTHRVEMSENESAAIESLRATYSAKGLEVPKLNEVLNDISAKHGIGIAPARRLFQHLLDAGEIIKVNDEFYFSASVMDHLRSGLAKHAAETPDAMFDVPTFKSIAGVSRKYAIPLLEYLDRERFTIRVGDKRMIRR